MFQDPILTHDSIVAEQARVDEANELRRMIADHPDRVIPRRHPVLAWGRGWNRIDRANTATAAPEARVAPDPAARPLHAR